MAIRRHAAVPRIQKTTDNVGFANGLAPGRRGQSLTGWLTTAQHPHAREGIEVSTPVN